MPRKAQVQRSAEEKFAIVIEGLKSGNIAETCRNHQIAATLYYRWKDEAEKAAVAALAGRNTTVKPDEEPRRRIRELERSLGKAHMQIDILKNVLGE
ncbi:MAG: transposase [Terriglobales bacterium]